MSSVLIAFLASTAVLALVFVVVKIRKGQIQTSDAVFWFFFAVCLVLLAVFPQIAFWLTGMLGIESPANFIFLCVVGILFVKMLMQSVEIARLNDRVNQLAQKIALSEIDEE